MGKRLTIISLLILGCWLQEGFLPQTVQGGTYPEKKITWIVPVKPGGGFDSLSRFLAPHVSNAIKTVKPGIKGGDIVLKNIPEAGGRRAYATIYKAPPDGYTIGDFNVGFITETLTAKPDFDVRKFTFLVRTGISKRVIATKKDGFKNWQEMMKAAREKEIKWAAGNFGRSAHIDSILAVETMGIPAKLINFPGTAENISAIIRGDVQVGLFSLDSVTNLLKAGEFRLLTIFDEKSEFPGVPSIKDLGYPELAETICFHRYIIGPPGMSKEASQVIIAAFQKTLGKKEVLDWADRMEFNISPLYGEKAHEVAQRVMDFYLKMAPVLLKHLK